MSHHQSQRQQSHNIRAKEQSHNIRAKDSKHERSAESDPTRPPHQTIFESTRVNKGAISSSSLLSWSPTESSCERYCCVPCGCVIISGAMKGLTARKGSDRAIAMDVAVLIWYTPPDRLERQLFSYLSRIHTVTGISLAWFAIGFPQRKSVKTYPGQCTYHMHMLLYYLTPLPDHAELWPEWRGEKCSLPHRPESEALTTGRVQQRLKSDGKQKLWNDLQQKKEPRTWHFWFADGRALMQNHREEELRKGVSASVEGVEGNVVLFQTMLTVLMEIRSPPSNSKRTYSDWNKTWRLFLGKSQK